MSAWFRRTPREPFLEAYLEATPKRISKKTPLSEVRFVALDAETTGLDVAKDRMLSLAIMELRQGRLQMATAESWIVYQNSAPLTSAVSVHGILPAATARGMEEEAVLRQLLPRLHGAVLVGHHVSFDVAMISHALDRHYGIELKNPRIDTAALAMRALDAFAKTSYPGQHAPSLDEVCAQSGLTPVDRHTAEGDTFTTAMLFLSLCARLQRNLGRELRLADLPLS